MSENWNSVIVPYNSQRKIATKKFYDSKGTYLDVISGKIIIKKIIINAKDQAFKKKLMLTSNFLTYYDLDPQTDSVVSEFSPLEVFDVNISHEVKIFELRNSQCLLVNEQQEVFFQLLTLNKKKMNVNFNVHMYYQWC